jgi:hypothetical protein
MRFVVGGRDLDLTQSEVVKVMDGQDPELVREYFVELPQGLFPPKQVLAVATSWDRSSFTSHEAVRVLSRLGLVCRRKDELRSDVEPDDEKADGLTESSEAERLGEIHFSVKVLEAAVAGIADRLDRLEALPRRGQ